MNYNHEEQRSHVIAFSSGMLASSSAMIQSDFSRFHGVLMVKGTPALLSSMDLSNGRVCCLLITENGFDTSNLCNHSFADIQDGSTTLEDFHTNIGKADRDSFAFCAALAAYKIASKSMEQSPKTQQFFPWATLIPDLCLMNLKKSGTANIIYCELYRATKNLVISRGIVGYLQEVSSFELYHVAKSRNVRTEIPLRPKFPRSQEQERTINFSMISATQMSLRRSVDHDVAPDTKFLYRTPIPQ